MTIESPTFDDVLWHKANQMCRGDKVHNLQIAMALYRSRFKDGESNGWNPSRKYDMEKWKSILYEIVNTP